ncbi:MAG TPA: SDR family oxidoreductase [Polyangiaceae bacterium]|nr:SDR family oxidoreductase [Polyangiaceae bacterium]
MKKWREAHHAVVIGASSAIGAAIAKRLRGGKRFVTAISRRQPGPETADAWWPADVRDRAALEDALAASERANGAIDALVYAAGEPAMGETLAVPEEVARAAFDVNFWGLERAVRAVLPGMMAREDGFILAVLSLAASRAIPHEAYYGASKAAAARWLECVAHEAEPRGVRVRYVCPGYIPTGFLERGGWHGMTVPHVNGSGITPDDVAVRALSLAGRRAVGEVIGWRERTITFADRIAPGLYDRWRARRR